jgi:hypothetical protein
MISIYLHSFMLIPLIVLELCPGQSTKCKNKQRAIIQRLGKAELLFLCTVHSIRSINLQSFMLIPLVVSKVCPGQEKRTDGRTDGRTDKAATICSPEGSIKSTHFVIPFLRYYLCLSLYVLCNNYLPEAIL